MEKSKVAISICETYEEEKVFNAVKEAVCALGGICSFVAPNEKVLVKPNFLYPAESSKAITTHPAVIKAVLRLLEEEKYENVLCGDSPAHGTCKAAFEKLGLDESHIALMDSEVNKDGLYFAKEAAECDAIIGVCKMKTHMLERITGALKNMYGLLYGKRKAAGHVTAPNANSFAELLTRIYKATPQRLHIMDAVVAMEGNGPSSGTPVNMGLIIASKDPIALDSVFCHLVYLDPVLVPTEVYGYKEGIGTYKEDEIEILLDGKEISMKDLVDRFGKKDFDVQREKKKFNILNLWSAITTPFSSKPVIEESKCIKCGMCVSQCPVEGSAVTFANGKENVPVYDYKKCIRCYCCQEVCPQHAIKSK